VPELSGRILVLTDKDKDTANRLATAIGEEFVSMRGKTAPDSVSFDEAVSTAAAFNGSPVVMADPADKAGGGAPSDNTTILRRRIERDVQDAAAVTVTALRRDCRQSFGPTQVPLGDCAAIRVGGLQVVLITNRTQASGLELFRNLGIEPQGRKLLVVKSTNHFMARSGVSWFEIGTGPRAPGPCHLAFQTETRPRPMDAKVIYVLTRMGR